MTYTPEQIEKMENSLATANKNGLPDLAKKIQVKLNQIYAQQDAEARPEKKSINFDRSTRGTKTPKTRKTVEVVEAVCDIQIEKIAEQKQEIKELKAVIADNGFVRMQPSSRGNTGRNEATPKTVKNSKKARKQVVQRLEKREQNREKSIPRQPLQKSYEERKKEYQTQKTEKKARRDTNIQQSEEIANRKKKFANQAKTQPKAKPEYTGRTIENPKKLGKRTIKPTDNSPVIVVDEQVKIIKSFVGFFVGKKTEDNFKNLFARIKKALLEKKITAQMEYAKQVMDIQKVMHKALTTGGKLVLEMPQAQKELLEDIAKSQKVSLSVTYLSAYINLMKSQDKAKIANLAKRIEVALEKGAITESSYYYAEIKTALAKLKTGKIVLNPEGLSGLGNIINGTDDGLGCLCNGGKLNGLGNIDADELSGADLYNSDTKGIGFTGEFLELMGDPTPAFSAVVFGPAKAGKTIFNMLFADYLQNYFGNVLYVSFEEFGSPTLAMKVKQLGVNENITFRGDLNTDLNAFDFVFIDSATKVGITSEQVEQLKKQYPQTAFITILQVTKNGNFRGTNDWVHNTQVIINVREGWADAYGRFGAGELDIFHLAETR